MTDIIKQFFKNLVCSESEPIIGPPEDLEKELKQALAKDFNEKNTSCLCQ